MSHEEDEDPLKKEDFYLDLQVSEEDEDLPTHGNSRTRHAATKQCCSRTLFLQPGLPAFLPKPACQPSDCDLDPASTDATYHLRVPLARTTGPYH